MDIWNVLGIAATADRAAIQAAYRSKLTETNPEDKPEEFKQLRAAYEQALALAKKTSTGEAPLTEGERWQQKAAAIYEDITRRRNTDL